MPSDKVTRPRANGNGERRTRTKPCFRFANPDKHDGALHWVPDNFPSFFGPTHLNFVDALIQRLIYARNDLDDPTRAPEARALIDRVMQTLGAFNPDSLLQRHELIVRALDHSEWLIDAPAVTDGGKEVRVTHDLNIRALSAAAIIREALPSMRVPPDVLRTAVELWPVKKRREARTRAVRELARALECDVPSLLPMLRRARKRLREERKARRARRRTT